MSTVDQEVEQLYGRKFVIDEHDGRYCRANVNRWLANWHEVTMLRRASWDWAETVADITLAVQQLDPRLRDLFVLHCVRGYSMDQCNRIYQWRHKRSFMNAWTELLAGVCRVLLDTQVHTPFVRRTPLGLFATRVEDTPPREMGRG